ncbi:hypothetical protein PABG_00943 [Paracoccidioides brasiliensis Pb03]|nr:hypothetical protein PABG_00943 [Paracoccidioides brasiliensis Pb03]
MSFLGIVRSRLVFTPVSVVRACMPPLSQGFHNSSARNALKETDRHREGIMEEIESSKEKHNQQRKDGDPRWHESLASASEADVKADRGEISPEEAQELEKHFPKGKSGGQKPANTGNRGT